MDMYYINERDGNNDEIDDGGNISLEFNIENGINNLMDTDNHNEMHQHAQDTDCYDKNCDFDLFDDF